MPMHFITFCRIACCEKYYLNLDMNLDLSIFRTGVLPFY